MPNGELLIQFGNLVRNRPDLADRYFQIGAGILSSYKRAAVKEGIEAPRATAGFLSPYSPDFNPIEKTSQLTAMLRNADERTVSGLWNLIGRLTASSHLDARNNDGFRAATGLFSGMAARGAI